MSTVENNVDKFRCNICNKSYKDKSGIWYHNKKYHIYIYPQKSSNLLQPSSNLLKNSSKLPKTSSDKQIKKINCDSCEKIFSRIDNLKRHKLKCNKNKYEQISKDETIDNLQKQLDDVKKTLMEIINKKCKIHPKTLQKINKQLNIDNNGIINENINKGTINNTYNIIALGDENLTDVFSKKEKMAILKYKYCSLPQLVEYTHFNDKYPQFKNILITNTQNKLAYKYDIRKKQFIAVDKDELLEDIVDERICDINSFYEELEGELDTKTKDILDKVKDKIENDPAYKELKKQDIKLIIYNNRKKVTKEAVNEIEV
jgi:hypothetical protein